MIEILEYLDRTGRSPYARWFDGLNAQAAAKVATAVTKISQGKLGDSRSVGHGVHEQRIDFGPGYRIYYARDGERVVILLGGGTKKRQQMDINDAVRRWQDYKIRKAQGEQLWR